MKKIFYIEDLMQELDIKSRSTFWRMRDKGEIPEPDVLTGRPRWSRDLAATFVPSLTTNPSV
ncbi:MAG TPA: hypothetical protein VGD04_10315 [Methylophilus sp.]